MAQLLGQAIKPGSQRSIAMQPGCLLSQHQEGGLEGVFRILSMPQNTLTDSQYQTSVPIHQGRERLFALALRKRMQKCRIAAGAWLMQNNLPEVSASSFPRTEHTAGLRSDWSRDSDIIFDLDDGCKK